MAERMISESLLKLLRSVDTPTVCNAIEVAQGKRGFAGFTKGTMQHSRPGAPPMVGFARTARIAGRNPSDEAPAVLRERRMDYFRSMAAGPRPGVAVVEDTDGPKCIAGWWGEVHSAVHKGLGLCGALTNGVMRDLDVMEPDFPVLAGSIGVSHGYVHVKEIGSPVTVFGLEIRQGDLIHADRHGALVIPDELLEELAEAINTVVSLEAMVLEPARQPDFSIQKLEQAWAEFEKKRT
ncbi:MAG: RraA family protein [Pseudomonadota bacterium]